MFLYKSNLVDKLINVAKSEDYVLNNPDLCFLLENPSLKSDTELAIKFNEYKQNIPNSGEEFVKYFYTNAPEIDTGTLLDWKNIIDSDPELNQYSINIDLEQTWIDKQNDSDYAWLSDLLDCLSKPANYSNKLSPSIGTMADSLSKYNLKNGNEGLGMALLGVPTYMVSKIPQIFVSGMMQLTDMIATKTEDVFNAISGDETLSKEDPYVLHNTELISGDLKGEISSKMGDEFRLYEHLYRFNPYDGEQNQSKADITGTKVTDKFGNNFNVSPNGNKIKNENNNELFSNTNRLSVNKNIETIKNDIIPEISHNYSTPFVITVYNSVLTSDRKFYGDKMGDSNSNLGYVSGTWETGIHILPKSYQGINIMKDKNIEIFNGCASNIGSVLLYFQSLIKSKFPTASIPKNINTAIEKGYKLNQLFVKVYFPKGNRVLPVFDCGGGAHNSKQGKPWIDITSQFFVSEEGVDIGYLITSDRQKVVSPSPMPNKISSTELNNIIYQNEKIVGVSIYDSAKVKGVPVVNAAFYFSNDHCVKYGLDPNIFGISSI